MKAPLTTDDRQVLIDRCLDQQLKIARRVLANYDRKVPIDVDDAMLLASLAISIDDSNAMGRPLPKRWTHRRKK